MIVNQSLMITLLLALLGIVYGIPLTETTDAPSELQAQNDGKNDGKTNEKNRTKTSILSVRVPAREVREARLAWAAGTSSDDSTVLGVLGLSSFPIYPLPSNKEVMTWQVNMAYKMTYASAIKQKQDKATAEEYAKWAASAESRSTTCKLILKNKGAFNMPAQCQPYIQNSVGNPNVCSCISPLKSAKQEDNGYYCTNGVNTSCQSGWTCSQMGAIAYGSSMCESPCQAANAECSWIGNDCLPAGCPCDVTSTDCGDHLECTTNSGWFVTDVLTETPRLCMKYSEATEIADGVLGVIAVAGVIAGTVAGGFVLEAGVAEAATFLGADAGVEMAADAAGDAIADAGEELADGIGDVFDDGIRAQRP
jgi:hypothetical protein